LVAGLVLSFTALPAVANVSSGTAVLATGSTLATTTSAVTTKSCCWVVRPYQLLGSDPGYNPGVGLGCTNCEVGTGFAMVNGRASYTVLIEIPQGALPPMSFTWANNVLPYLP
jgi:hypothetical protein